MAQPVSVEPSAGNLFGAVALGAATAGADALSQLTATDRLPARKSARHDLVTAADSAVEAAIVTFLQTHRPGDAILGEEGGLVGEVEQSESASCWIVDPIDGTTNFVHGRPDHAISVGFQQAGAITAGAVLRPADGVWAAAGADTAWTAFDDQLTIADNPAESALVAVGFCHDPVARRKAYEAVVPVVASVIRDWRWIGSAAADLLAVATGQLDGYVGVELPIWDTAAGLAIVRAAGGVDTVAHVHGLDILLAGRPSVVDAMREVLLASDPTALASTTSGNPVHQR